MSLGTQYLVGSGGARLVWADGRTTTLPERSIVRLERRPRRIIGKLIALHTNGSLTYEAPEFQPHPPGGLTTRVTETQPRPPDPQPHPPQPGEPPDEPEDEDQPEDETQEEGKPKPA